MKITTCTNILFLLKKRHSSNQWSVYKDPTKIFKIGSRKIRPGLVGRSSPLMLMTKWCKFLHSGHFLGLKLLNFLSFFYCISLNYCWLISIKWANCNKKKDLKGQYLNKVGIISLKKKCCWLNFRKSFNKQQVLLINSRFTVTIISLVSV